MSLIRYNPWEIFDAVERAFVPSTAQGEATRPTNWVPVVDIREEDDKYVISADIPGVEPKDIDIQTENKVLTVRGERKTEHEEKEEGYIRRERVSGSFERSFRLPDVADLDKIEAKYENGELHIVVPKRKEATARKIEVKH